MIPSLASSSSTTTNHHESKASFKTKNPSLEEPQNPSEFSFVIARIAVSWICQLVGYKATQLSALNALIVVATKYLEAIAKSASSLANTSKAPTACSRTYWTSHLPFTTSLLSTPPLSSLSLLPEEESLETSLTSSPLMMKSHLLSQSRAHRLLPFLPRLLLLLFPMCPNGCLGFLIVLLVAQ